MEQLLAKIAEKIQKGFDLQAMKDMYATCKEAQKTHADLAANYLRWLSDECERVITSPARSESEIKAIFDLHKKVCLAGARDSFHLFLLYVEWNREPDKKFYPPRRKVLQQVVDAMQALDSDDLDLLAISLPPGVGKTTLAIFYLCWLAGKYPNDPILTCSYSNSFVQGVYGECLRILDPQGDYLWYEVFPEVQIVHTNAKDCKIDLGKRKRFETLEFTSTGSGNAGQYRARRLLYCDDLVSGIEEALSKERLDKLWGTYNTDLLQRKIGKNPTPKELHIATRWSVHDVIGRLETENEGNERVKFIRIPAVNDKDESNFDYAYDVGFSTQFYHEQREIMDDANWRALYLNEPIEREGILYERNELRRYFELPDTEPDAILAVCDTKDRGKDYCVMPIVYQYGNDLYVEDMICDNGKPEAVESRLTAALLRHKVQMARFESNSAGGRVAKEIQREVKTRGGRTKITTKYNTANKDTRIIVASPFIKERCLFKDDSVIAHDREYRRMLEFLCGYTMAGKNKFDDVPDAFSMLADFVQSFTGSEVQVFPRPW